MTQYAQLPDGIILPETLARSVMNDYLFGNRGAYRTASPSNKNTAGWTVRNGSADADTLADLPTVRDQARDLVRNEALPSGAISTVVTAVVGTGVVPQSRLDYEFLGLSEEQAAAWQARAERIFNHWADSTACDSTRQMNFWQMQELVQRSKLVDGDVLAIRRYLPRPGAMLGIAWQIVEGDRVRTPTDNAVMLAEKTVRSGVELDKGTGEAVAYHIQQVHPSEQRTVDDQKWTRVPARDRNGNPLALLIARRLRAGQTRGVPYLAPVVELLKQLGRYTEAEVTAAVISGFFSVVVQTPHAGTGASPVQSLPFAGGIPGAVMGAQQQLPQGNKVSKLQSGIIMDLAPGEELKVVEAPRPNTAFDPFVLSLLRQIGAALELPFEVLVKHFTASYSASRAALIEAWRLFTKERDQLVTEFCRPVWQAVLTEAIALGLLDAPDFFTDPLKREAWLAADWIGLTMPQIDPLKEANAAKAWNELNVLSLQDITNQQGRDFDRTVRQIARERRLLGQLLPQPALPAPANDNGGQAPSGADQRVAAAADTVRELVASGEMDETVGGDLLFQLGVGA